MSELPMTDQHAYHLKSFYEKGDKTALEKFFVDNFDLIYRVSYHYTKNKADAEDVCQQVMIQVMDSKSKCNGAYEGSDQVVLGWLSILTANQARMFLRKNKRSLIRDNKKGAEMQMEKSEKMNEKISHDNDEFLEYALEKIPVLYKNAILLKYYDGLSYTEIAETLGLREVTIRSYVSRGIEQMRLLLNKKATTTISTVLVVSMVTNRKVSASFETQRRKLVAKTINSSDSQKVSIVSRRRPKKALVFNILVGLSFVAFAIFTIFQYLNAPQKPEQQNQIAETTKAIPFSKSWDFSKDTGDDIKITRGSWSLDKEKGFMISADEQFTLAELPFNFINYYKLEADALFYGVRDKERFFAFQSFSEGNEEQQVLSEDGGKSLSDSILITKPTPSMKKFYYKLKFFIYFFEDYLLVGTNDQRCRLLKMTNAQNKAFKLAIQNLEISKMKYQPIGKEDREYIDSILPNLEKNIIDKNLFQQIKAKLQTYFAELPD